jgi:hypothetical protein
VATDYDELRTDVKESQDSSLEALQSAKAPDAKSVVQELDEADVVVGGLSPLAGYAKGPAARIGHPHVHLRRAG